MSKEDWWFHKRHCLDGLHDRILKEKKEREVGEFFRDEYAKKDIKDREEEDWNKHCDILRKGGLKDTELVESSESVEEPKTELEATNIEKLKDNDIEL